MSAGFITGFSNKTGIQILVGQQEINVGQNFMTAVQDTANLIWAYVPNLVGALAILIIGWIVAGLLARLARAGLAKTGLAGRVSKFATDVDPGDSKNIEVWFGKAVFFILMLFVLIGFFQALGLTPITQPISGFLNEIFEYLPRLIGPVVLILVAWVIAKFLRLAVRRGLESSRFGKLAGTDGDEDSAIGSSQLPQTAGEAVYWLTFLVFLPAILGSLELGGLLGPVRSVVGELLGYLPNLFAAGLILFVGWIVAKLVRKIITNVLASIGTDSLSERVGLQGALGKQKLSDLAGLVVYILILIPIIIAALNAMSLSAITQPASDMLQQILGALPGLFAATLLLVIAYVVAKIVSGLVSELLAGVGFDALPSRLGIRAASSEKAAGRTPSAIAGFVLMIAIMLFAVVEAFDLIGFEAVGDLVSVFLIFAGQVLLGLFIIGLGLYLARVVADAIRDSNLKNGVLLATTARIAILILAFAMGLGEMGLGDEIITLAFGLTLGAVAIALAIAFGIGGRDEAAKLVAKWSRGNSSDTTPPES